MITQEDVTIIIPHLGATSEQEYSLNKCLASLEETFTGRVIVVGNGMVCGHQVDIRIQEQGQCKAVNAAAATVNTPYIFVSNDDMIYVENWYERLVDDLDDLWCISPTLIEPRPGAPTFLEHFCGGAGGDFNMDELKKYVGELYLTVKAHNNYRNGFNLPFLIKKELWDTIGGYDVAYDPWGSNSDSDLLYKIRLAGIQPVQNRASFVYHFSQTSGTFEPQYRSYWEKNFKYFEDKWGFTRTDNRIWEADFEMPDNYVGPRIFSPYWEGRYA